MAEQLMDPAFAAYQARLETFAPPKSRSRRPSKQGKKAAPKASSKGGWPLALPRPEDLAYAGFIFKPTTASPDNVQCFSCQTQLDGWEETDVPAFEHLTHSPNCGFAINVCIRLRASDPGRTEDDPLSEAMVDARRMTFEGLWPLDEAAGFPGIEQMISAGWYYDPSDETPDGVTCPYCSLSLDAWDAGDDPMEEHRKRSADCLFFTLKEFYHPTKKAPAPRGKRSSSRSSTASRKGTKGARAKKTASKEDLSKPLPPTPDEAPSKMFAESYVESVSISVASGPAKATAKGRRTRKATLEEAPTEVQTESFTDSVASGPAKKARKPKKAPAPKRVSTISTTSTTRGTRRTKTTSDGTDLDVPIAPAPKVRNVRTKRASEDVSMTASAPAITRNARSNKRSSDHINMQEDPPISSKRAKISELPSDLPEFESTPMKTPPQQKSSNAKLVPSTLEAIDVIDVAGSMTPEGSPPRTPGHVAVRTPEARTTERTRSKWDPINVDDFFEPRQNLFGVISDVIVDAGLDKENMDVAMGDTPEALVESVKAGLTSPEKKMTIEEWVMYNAKRGEEKLRTLCERQIVAFENEGRRALATLDAIPVS